MLSQIEALRFYGQLQAVAARHNDDVECWHGEIVLSIGLGASGSALAIAAHIAGAVSLCLEPDLSLCRAALRTGACDFLVNTLDEALRVMKNEVRRKQPLSVALHAPLDQAVREIIERGVRPTLFADLSTDTDEQVKESWYQLASDYFKELKVEGLPGSAPPAGFETHTYTFSSLGELREFDKSAAATLAEDPWRKRWLLAAPSYFHRERPLARVLLVTSKEQQALANSLPASAAVDGPISSD